MLIRAIKWRDLNTRNNYGTKSPKSELVLVALLRTDVVEGTLRYIDVRVRSLLTTWLIGALLSIQVLVGALVALRRVHVLIGALVLSVQVMVVLLRIHILSTRSHEGLKDTLCCIQVIRRTPDINNTFRATSLRVLKLHSCPNNLNNKLSFRNFEYRCSEYDFASCLTSWKPRSLTSWWFKNN